MCGVNRTFSMSHSGLWVSSGSGVVTSSPAQLAALERFDQCVLIDYLAPSDVDHIGFGPRDRELARAQEMAGLGCKRQRHHDEVAKLHQLDAFCGTEPSLRNHPLRIADPRRTPSGVGTIMRIALEREHLHAEGLSQTCGLPSD